MADAKTDTGDVGVTFLGASTLLIDDGTDGTRLLIDGFFTRPNPLRLAFGRLEPDCRRIRDALARARIKKLHAVLVAHSHVDHALDSAAVAALTDADALYGSDSTRRIVSAQGYDLSRFVRLEDDSLVKVGDFVITVRRTGHSPGDLFPGEITGRFPSRPRVWDFKAGPCYSFHIAHKQGASQPFIVHASAGVDSDKPLKGPVAVIFLGVGTLGLQDDDFRDEYWKHTVEAVEATKVVPIHWDRFTSPLKPDERYPKSLPVDFKRTEQFLTERGIRWVKPALWERRPLRRPRARRKGTP